ncbi:uncharacterized protein BKA78DRAFT_75725 [Phyllosticta capitalensis]|uniref:Uncharacterized protein n=1 Tax=Phyllosticta capitalensis TaxID=121624 RepID=A0ABR1YYY1_9PEZI
MTRFRTRTSLITLFVFCTLWQMIAADLAHPRRGSDIVRRTVNGSFPYLLRAKNNATVTPAAVAAAKNFTVTQVVTQQLTSIQMMTMTVTVTQPPPPPPPVPTTDPPAAPPQQGQGQGQGQEQGQGAPQPPANVSAASVNPASTSPPPGGNGNNPPPNQQQPPPPAAQQPPPPPASAASVTAAQAPAPAAAQPNPTASPSAAAAALPLDINPSNLVSALTFGLGRRGAVPEPTG